jgi:hypothetical protein
VHVLIDGAGATPVTGCWPRCPSERRYGAKVTSVRRRWVVLLVAAMAAAGCTGGGSRAPSPAPPSPPPPASTVTWTDCRLPSEPGALVRAVDAGGEGIPWTAVGQEGGTGSSDPVRPAVWTSPDGCAWRRAAVAPVTPDGQRTGFSAVARRGRLVAALGRSYSQVHGNIRPTLWRSDAAAPLREVELSRELFGGRGITMDGLVATPQAFLATGAYLGPDGNVAVHVWRSTNGADWVRLPPGRPQSSTPAEQLLPRDIAAGAAGSVLVGTSLRVTGGTGFDGAAWYAPAASRQWQRVDLTGTGLAEGGDQRLVAVAPLGDGYVAVGAAGSDGGFQLRSAVSPDGVRWSAGGPLVGQPLPAGTRPSADVAGLPDGGVVAGTVAGGRTELWVSPDGRSWTPEVVPGLADRPSGVVLGASQDRLVLAVQTPAGPQLHLGRAR